MRFDRREFLKKGAALLASGLTMPRNLEAAASSRAERIHIGAQTNAFGNPMRDYQELLKVLETLAPLGYRGFETNYRSLDPEASQAEKCRRDFAARQMQLVALHCGYQPLEKLPLATQKENLRRIAGYSAAMGARFQIVSGGSVYGSSGNRNPQAVREWIDGLNQLGEAVKKEGVTLCYHNHRTEFEGHPSLMSYILQDTDANLVELNFDVGHAVGIMDAAVYSSEHWQRIAIYHLKDTIVDSSGKIVHVDLGKGRVDLRGTVAPLLHSNWSGWLEIEEDRNYPKPLEQPAETLRADREYLREITGV